jgi:hypothetical protein
MSITLIASFFLFAASPVAVYVSWREAKPVIESVGVDVPAALGNADAPKWNSWASGRDKAIRARLEQGDLDSMINLLLFGTSFTKQPRIHMAQIGEASKSGVLRARVDDLVAGVRRPGENERLNFVRTLLREKGVNLDTGSSDAGVFIYSNLQRVMEEQRQIAARAADAKHTADTALDRSSLFSNRGVSLDTTILPDFALEQTLRDLQQRGEFSSAAVKHIAVVGPGLDFSDKNEESSYDYYPPQTVQPFALYDSLVRLELARPGNLNVSVLDISPRVLQHIRRAREKARQGEAYTIQLPRDVSRLWPGELNEYWKALGDRIGSSVEPMKPPDLFNGLETRAVRVRPDVVLACEPVDLNVVLQRMQLQVAERFDLVVGTNIFVYYDRFQQRLALENIGAMLKPGGLLLTNDKLPDFAGGSMEQAGVTIVRYNNTDTTAVEAMGWYRRKQAK